MHKYPKGIEKLNDQQKDAVQAKDGPLLVVAGAGTGKTHVITEKINKLLGEGVDPRAILAITFTEKAAAEMSQRVLEKHGGLLLDMSIATFNGYGDSLLREFGIHIGIPKNFRLLTVQAAIVFVRERFDLLKLDYFYPATGSPNAIVEDILQYFSKLKQHLVRPKTYQEYAKSLTGGDEAETEEKRMHLELAYAYATYISLCRESNVIDYDDQIYLVIELLEKRPNVQKTLRNRFHSIFVDEFQDTNPMQSRLIDLMMPESRNLIVVGDDDQAIYGFRGATISNILQFDKRYPDTASVALTTNYRSHQSILDAAYTLIKHNNPNRLEVQLGLQKRLTSDMPGNEPKLFHFVDSREELDWIASDISNRLKELKKDERPSIAILTRSNNGAGAMHQILSTFGIPHSIVGLSPDLYKQPIIRMLLELVRTLLEPDNNASLQHTLTGELFGVSNEVIAQHALKASREHDPLEDLLVNLPKTKQAIESIHNWRNDTANESVGRLLWRVITETGLTKRLLAQANTDDAAANALGHLAQFFDTLKEFENIATQPTVVQYQLALPALMAAGESTDGTLGLNENEVIVTTVHKAKGLEWDTVYLPQLTMQKFPMYKQGSGIELPETLRANSLSAADEHYSEERRVMYVAITRARKNLIFSYSDGVRKPSMFLNEIFGEEAVANTPHTVNDTGNTRLNTPADVIPRQRVPARIYDGTTVTLDVTHAQTLLNCPRNFYYKYVIETPREPSAAADIGTQMHGFIEEINKSRMSGTEIRPLTDMLGELERGWNKAGYHSKIQQQRRLKIAKESLVNFYKQALSSPAPTRVEEKFRVQLEDNLVLYGRIDAIFEQDGVEIRDYKTGFAAKTQEAANKNITNSKQLEFYALAWLAQYGEMPSRLSLHYVDTNIIGMTSRKQQKTLESRKQKLIKAVEDLKKGNFPLGSSHRYCEHPPIEEV
ncbi:MAG: ATP-dependent DNA helicase [Patescibacteria group bacterium]